MSALQPRTLSNAELIRYFATYMDNKDFGAPIEWQHELLRRFTAIATDHAYPVKDERQLDLFV